MKAAVFKQAGKPLVIEARPDPAPGAGQVVIRVERCGVCGTDLHMTSGHGASFPDDTVIGHEYCGEVVAVGKGVDKLKVGQRIASMPAAGCGQCQSCLAGFPLGCARMQGVLGGFGEYAAVYESSSILLPQTLSSMDGALVEPIAVGLRGVRLAQMRPGARVAVLGAGSIGLAAIYWARLLGAGRIVALSRSARRADMAGQMGADQFVAFGEDEAERLNAALGGVPEVVLECTGAVGTMQRAIELAGPGATIVSLGFCTSPDPVVPALATWKQLTMKFSFAYDLNEFQHSADMMAAGHLEPRQMVSNTIGLDAFPAILESLRAGASETKVHVDPWSAK